MKKLLLIFFAISIAISAQEFKRYAFKSGKVVYKSSGSMTGSEIMWMWPQTTANCWIVLTTQLSGKPRFTSK